MSRLSTIDLAVFLFYLVGIGVLGCSFIKKSRTVKDFTRAGKGLPGWAVGLSIFGTYLSSNTYLGIPGKAFATNWNSFVFSLSIPLATYLAVKFYVPFYRSCGEISAYTHLEKRFGLWARTYAVVCYLLTELARVGTILFGMSLALQPLMGWSTETIIVVTGLVTTLYTVVGGIRAVVWTDVVQSGILIGGAVVLLVAVLMGLPEGPGQAVRVAANENKFSLGSLSGDLTQATFWSVFFYGVFTNLNNFGIDQNYVQRYLVAPTTRAAARSVWFGALLYVPVSLLFFVIGSSLYSYHRANPEYAEEFRLTALAPKDGTEFSDEKAADGALPYFISRKLPSGIGGLVIAGAFAAAMSTLSTCLNSSATVFHVDVWKRYVRPESGERESMLVLHGFTLLWGLVGTAAAMAMIGIRSLLDTWWQLSGTIAGAMLGLFLLGMISRRADGRAAGVGVTAGLLVICWMSFSTILPAPLQLPLHPNWVIVFGTLTIVAVGMVAARYLSVAEASRAREHA